MAREKKNEQVKVNFNSNNAFLKDKLSELDEKFKGDDSVFGMTLLTRTGYISGNRSIMTTGHLKQAMTPINPEFPKVFTEYENMDGYLKAHNWEDSDAWRKDMRKKVLAQNELDEKSEELRKMAEEHGMQDKEVVQAAELGGAKE